MIEDVRSQPELESPYETAARKLSELVAWEAAQPLEASRNEATTRLHLIDRLLRDCLGWPIESITTEEAYERTYVDYLMRGDGTHFLLEAKREGISFKLPPGFGTRFASLQTIRDVAPEVWPAIGQALNYCLTRGIPLGAVSNGHQLIGFIGSRRDGVPPAEGRAVIYSSLEEILESFPEVWRYFSQAGVDGQYLYAELQRATHAPPPPKLSSTLFRYPGTKNRNQLQTELQILGELFLVDVLETGALEQRFLEEAYSSSGALSQYALVSKEILQTRYNAFFGELGEVTEQPVNTKKGLAPELTADVLAASVARRPIILLGDVGVGKTTFVRRLIHVDAKDLFERATTLYVDFGREPALVTEIEKFVRDSFIRQLRENYNLDVYERNLVRGVYHGELERFSRGIYADLREEDPPEYKRQELAMLAGLVNDTERHLKACLDHISSAQNRQIVIFLDNVDQRPFQFQEQVFLIAQSLAANWSGTVFVALRPETFYRSRREGSLAAYQPRVFSIAPPRVDDVLRRRLEFARARLTETGTLEALGPGIGVQSSALELYIGAILYSLRVNTDLIVLIDNLSAGNIRRALDFVTAFVGSGHVDSEKIVGIMERTGRYTIAVHEFLRAVIYGDAEHYDPTASPIANLFDVSAPDGREHFLAALLLAFVERTGDRNGSGGYVPVTQLFDEGQRLGFLPSQIQDALERCRGKNLIEGTLRGVMFGQPDLYRITAAGAYTVKRLSGAFSYVDAMIVDTPITDQTVRGLVSDTWPIVERLNRAQLVRRYLDESWQALSEHHPAFDWADRSGELGGEIDVIARRVGGG